MSLSSSKSSPAAPKIRLLKGEKRRDFVLSAAGEREYLSLAPQPLKDAAILLLDTGLRVGEAVALKWEDIELQPAGDAKFGYLRVREGETKKAKRTVPLTARVKLMLQARLAAGCHIAGRSPLHRAGDWLAQFLPHQKRR